MRSETEARGAHLIMFVGTTPNIGTTACAFSTAAALARGAPQMSVAYMCLNLKSSKIARYIGVTGGEGLSAIRADLKARSLTRERLDKQMVQPGMPANLYVLVGNREREQAELYTAEDIGHLLDIAMQAFDICVVDCNAYWDNAATVVTALRARTRMLVTTPQLDSFYDDFRGWLDNTANLFGLAPRQFQLIVSESARHADVYQYREIEQATGLAVTGKWPCDRHLSADMQLGRLHEWCALKSPKEIEQIACHLAEDIGINWMKREARSAVRFPFRSWKRQMEVNM